MPGIKYPTPVTDDKGYPKYSDFELLEYIIRSLQGYMRTEEKEFVEEKANLPTDTPQQDPFGFYLTASQISSYIRDWRREKIGQKYDTEKLEELDKAVHDLFGTPTTRKDLKRPKPEVDLLITKLDVSQEKQPVHYTLDTRHLPHIQGCLRYTANPHHVHMLVDSGATDNILNVSLLRQLGMKIKDIQNKKKYVLSSATGKDEDGILGDVELTLFLRSVKGKYYPIKQKFCVLKGPLLTPILSMKLLRELHFAWRQKLDPISKEPVDEILSLNVPHPARGKTVRRSFRTHQQPAEGNGNSLRNDKSVSLQTGEVSTVDLVMDNPPRGFHLGRIKLETDLLEINEPQVRVDRTWKTSEQECYEGFRRNTTMTVSCTIKAKRDLQLAPGKIKTRLEPCERKKGHRELVLGFSEPEASLPPIEDPYKEPNIVFRETGCYFSMTSSQMSEPHTSAGGETLPDFLPTNFEDSVLHNTVYTEFETEDACTPAAQDLTHLDTDTAQRVEKILRKHRSSISSSKLDVGKIKGHEVEIEPIDENDPATDKFRHQTDAKADLIESCIQEMVDNDIVMEADEPSEWRSNILLVAKPEDGEHFVDRTKASYGQQKKTGAHKNKKMKNPRVTLDLRSFNQKVKSTGALRLPKVEQVLLRLRNKKASKIDIKNAFYSVVLRPASRKYTCFVSPKTGKRYFFKRIPQGAKNSPQIFQEILSKILCENTWEEFKDKRRKDMPDTLADMQLASCLVTYVDDLLLLTDTVEEHLFLLEYVFSMCGEHGLKIDRKKIDILPEDLTYLGVCINCKDGTYRLHNDRVQAFRQWMRPTTREQLVSRLATISYFSGLLPALKVVCGPLFLLLRSKDKFVWCDTAEMAWQSLKFLLAMNIEQTLIDSNAPLIMTVDASLLAIAGNLFQLDTVNNRLVLCASFSKVLSLADAGKSNLYRELLGLLFCVQHFSIHIRSNTQKCLVLTDCSALSFLRQLKSTNTRLQGIAMYLSSFDNLALFHISGSSNFLSDSFSRMFAGQSVDMGLNVPKEALEKFGPSQLPEHSVINPDALRSLLQQPPDTSQYKKTHVRKKIICPASLATEVVDNLEGFTTEEKVIRAALLGYDPGMKTDYFWNKEARTGNMTRKKFRDYEKKYKLEAIRDNLQILCSRVSKQTAGTPLNTKACDRFVISLRDLTSEYPPSAVYRKIQDLCDKFLNEHGSEQLLDQIIAEYVQSDLYKHGTSIKDLYTVIPVYTNHTSDMEIVNKDGKMYLAPISAVHLEPAQVHTFRVNMKIVSDLHITRAPVIHTCAMFPQDTAFDRATYVDTLFITNDAIMPVILDAGEPVLQILAHDGNGVHCSCISENFLARAITSDLVHAVAGYDQEQPLDKYRYATDTLVSNTGFAFSTYLSGISSANLPRDTRRPFCTDADLTMLRQNELSNANPCDDTHIRTVLDSEISVNCANSTAQGEGQVSLPDPHNPESTVEGEDQVYLPDPPNQKDRNSSTLNQFLFLANAIHNSHLSIPQLQTLQDTDPQIRKVREELVENPANPRLSRRFILRDGIVCRQVISRARVAHILAIYLPDFVTKIVLTSLHHHKNLHMSRRAVLQFFNSMFFNPRARELSNQVATECVSCTFNTNCSIRKSVGKHSRDTPHPGKIFVADFIENLPTSSSGHKFICIFIDIASNYTVFLPLRTKSSKHLTTEFHKTFSLIGMPDILEVDLGSAFRGIEFRSFCKLHGIDLVRPGTPHRHYSNRAEGHIRHARHFITNTLLNGETASRRHWASMIPEITSAYNMSVPHGSVNDLSRMALFLGRRPINITSVLPDTELRELSIKNLYKRRTEAFYHSPPPNNQFRVGQLVKILQNKADLGHPSGLKPNATNLARILDVSVVGCRVRLLLNNSVRQISYEYLRPMTLAEAHSLHSYPLVLPDYLDKSLPKRGRQKTLYEEVTSQGIGDHLDHHEPEPTDSPEDHLTDPHTDPPEGQPSDPPAVDHIPEFDSDGVSYGTGVTSSAEPNLGSIVDPVTGTRRSARTAAMVTSPTANSVPATLTVAPCQYTSMVAAFNYAVFGDSCPTLTPSSSININTIKPLLAPDCSDIVRPRIVNVDVDVQTRIVNKVKTTDNLAGLQRGKRSVRFANFPFVSIFDPLQPPASCIRNSSQTFKPPWPEKLVLYDDRKYFHTFLTSLNRLGEDLASV